MGLMGRGHRANKAKIPESVAGKLESHSWTEPSVPISPSPGRSAGSSHSNKCLGWELEMPKKRGDVGLRSREPIKILEGQPSAKAKAGHTSIAN